jgi:hypothetical protein
MRWPRAISNKKSLHSISKRSNFHSFPFMGGARGGNGDDGDDGDDGFAVAPHPHPSPPLEGEGIIVLVSKRASG